MSAEKTKRNITLADYPDIAKRWHPTKNEDLTPDMVTYGSAKNIWWMCERGHEWKTSVNNRIHSRGYCPYCYVQKPLEGNNNLSAKYPELAKEWHPTKNGNLTPDIVAPRSGKKVWWVCERGHEYSSKVWDRTNGVGCPYCAGKKVLSGYNDLATTNPDIAKQWHPTRNGDLTPETVTRGSRKKVWWRCEHGHEWEAIIFNRTSRSPGCPICSGNEVRSRFKESLSVTHPELAKQWHPTLNENLTTDMVTAGSNRRVWWTCDEGHEWVAAILNRAHGSGCPFCSGQKILEGFNDLATTHPDIAKEWHPTKNGDLTPKVVNAGCNKKVWWICNQGHEYQSMIRNRTKYGNNCPYCSGQKVIKDINDIATTHPELAAQWHPTKNGDLTPDMVTAGAKKKAWWICEHGHEWEAKIGDRARNDGCPICSGKRVLAGYNDLATTDPDIAKQWHPTKNGELTPEMVTRHSNKKVWWVCENGHERNLSVDNMIRTAVCPYCKGTRKMKG